MSQILVLNAGSSSLKFALYQLAEQQPGSEQPELQLAFSGLAERLGSPEAQLRLQAAKGEPQQQALPQAQHSEALAAILRSLNAQGCDALLAVGHRVVHGGERFQASCRITPEVTQQIAALCQLAPLHNPANLSVIQAMQALHPDLPQVAVFDTAFHHSLPAYASAYALPATLYQQHGIRRYGFHGSSHRYVSQAARAHLGPAQSRLVTAHLGNGCSVCAVKDGLSLDTSMGLTPLEGLVMGSRSGDLDPGILLYLQEQLGYSLAELRQLLNQQAGLKGLSGLSNDCRELLAARAEGHAGADLALNVFCYRVAKYIAAYLVPLGGLDALVFTGGIGENAPELRAQILHWLRPLGFELDPEANQRLTAGQTGQISVSEQPRALVIPTDEEKMIALDTLALLAEPGAPERTA